MPIPIILAAGLMSLPNPVSGRITVYYPKKALSAGKSGAVRFRTMINASGKPYRCEILSLYGDEIFGKASCDQIMKTEMTVPRDSNGNPTNAMINLTWRYAQNPGDPVQKIADPIDLGLNAPPGSAASTFLVSVQVERDGKVSACRGYNQASAQLEELACSEFSRLGRPIATDEKELPVAYVVTLKVRAVPSSPN